MERDPKGHLKIHFRASNSTRYSSYGRVVSVFNGKYIGGPTKRFPAILAIFSNFGIFFLKGNPGASKNPSGTSQIAVVPEIWPPEVSISLGKKNRDFLKFRFSDPLKAQNSPQRGPSTPGHLIGHLLCSGFTSGLRPLPTWYVPRVDDHPAPCQLAC